MAQTRVSDFIRLKGIRLVMFWCWGTMPWVTSLMTAAVLLWMVGAIPAKAWPSPWG